MSEIRCQKTEIKFHFRRSGHGLIYLSHYMKNQGLKLNRGPLLFVREVMREKLIISY